MNGVHDLGGKHGFGPVEREQNEPCFHADWEKAVMVMNLIGLVKRIYNIDEFRHAVERMGQAEYLNTSYFEPVLEVGGVEVLCLAHALDGVTELVRDALAMIALDLHRAVLDCAPRAAQTLELRGAMLQILCGQAADHRDDLEIGRASCRERE